jgi:hypothetical protein
MKTFADLLKALLGSAIMIALCLIGFLLSGKAVIP